MATLCDYEGLSREWPWPSPSLNSGGPSDLNSAQLLRLGHCEADGVVQSDLSLSHSLCVGLMTRVISHSLTLCMWG